jgi:hypothetical protein
MTHSVIGNLNLNLITSLAGIAGPLILIVTEYAAIFNAPGYNLVKDSISSLAWTRLGWVQTIGFLAIGLLVELFVAGLFFNIRRRRGFGLGMGILVFFGFGLLMVGAFHTDPAAGPRTIEGMIHIFSAKTIFWLFSAAVLLVAFSLKNDPYWQPLFLYSIIAAWVALILMACIFLFAEERGWFGLFERILVANSIIWVEIMAIWLLRMALTNKPH